MPTTIIHSLEELPTDKQKIKTITRTMNMVPDSVFLAGPFIEGNNWREEACNLFKGKSFLGTVFCPSIDSPEDSAKTTELLQWNKKTLRMSSTVLFWLPCNKDEIDFDTIFQLARRAHSDLVVVGMPEGVLGRRDISNYYAYEYAWKDTHKTLEETVSSSMKSAFKHTNFLREVIGT